MNTIMQIPTLNNNNMNRHTLMPDNPFSPTNRTMTSSAIVMDVIKKNNFANYRPKPLNRIRGNTTHYDQNKKQHYAKRNHEDLNLDPN